MRVARQASAPATGGFVFQLKAESHDKGEDTFEERLAIAQQLQIGCFVLKIDGEGPVFTALAGRVAHGYPSSIRSRKLRRHHEGNALQSHTIYVEFLCRIGYTLGQKTYVSVTTPYYRRPHDPARALASRARSQAQSPFAPLRPAQSGPGDVSEPSGDAFSRASEYRRGLAPALSGR